MEATIAVAEDALASLRKAYAVADYHHWERSALQWTNRKTEKHDDLVRRVRALDHPIDPRLDVVRDRANLLKHANDRWGLALVKSWSDVFPPAVRYAVATGGGLHWYDRVALSDAHIKTIIAAVRGSGPSNPPIPF